jgi:hypothetical protein
MIRIPRLATIAIVAAGLLSSSVGADDSASKPAAAASKTAAAGKPQRKLTPELIALRDRVRQVLAAYKQQTFNTQQNSPTDIMSVCLAFGCGAEVLLEGQEERRINGITCLCWNYPCCGFEMLGPSHGRLAAQIGYGSQQHSGEFLAMLAMSHVKSDYPLRVGKRVRNITDLVEAEKLGCRSGSDLSLKLIGLAYYVPEPQWKNDLGETWSIERMIEDGLAHATAAASEIGLNRLLGWSYAVDRREKRGQPIEGALQHAKKYVGDYQSIALQMQNSDGSWGPSFLAAYGASADAATQLRSTGRVLEWLAFSLPDSKIGEPGMVNAAECLIRLLSMEHYQWHAPTLPTGEIASLGHALHALSIYDERVFQPAEADAKPAEK